MNQFAALIALTFAAAGAAQAGDIDPAFNSEMFAPTLKTRAEVKAELLQARADGTMARRTELRSDMDMDRPVAAGRLAAPRALAVGDFDADLARAVMGEDSGSFYLSQITQPAKALLAARR